MITAPTCSTCQVVFNIGRRTSQESADDEATKQGWTLGYPRGQMFCPQHPPRRSNQHE